MRAGLVRVSILALAGLAGCAPVVPPPARDGGNPSITSFAIVSPPVQAAIGEAARTISLDVPSGTDVSSLVAVFVATGESVSVGGVQQITGVTVNDFSGPVEYVVDGADGSHASYVARVSVLPPASQEKAITAFSFLQPQVTALIDERSKVISAAVPHDTDVSSLVTVFSTTGARVTVADTEQESGMTINDFTDPVEYTVIAADGSAAHYVVEVEKSPGQDKKLVSFSLQVPGAASMIDEAQRMVRVRVPDGSNLSSLAAVFSSTGMEVRVSGRLQESGITANDFTLPVAYEVIAEDGSSVVYTVQVTAHIGLVINELDADQVGVDNAEFIELLALQNVDLWGIVVVLLNGGVTPGQEYGRVDLSSLGTLPQGGYLVIAGPLVPVAVAALKLTPPGWESSNRIQNGPSDAIVLWDTFGHRMIDAVSYAGVLHRAVISGEPGEVDATEGSASAPSDSNTVTGSLGRSPNGTDTGQNGVDFKFINTLTPGAPNP